MPKFSFKAQAPDGSARNGVRAAATAGEAELALQGMGLTVTSLAPKRSLLQMEVTPKRLKKVELMHMSRQLAAFIRAGIPILEAISVMAEEAESTTARKLMKEIAADLRIGSTLSEAIERHPKDFPPFYRGILRSAEFTGQLDTVLDQLSVYLERDVEAKRKLKSAMIYPTAVAIMSVVTIVILAVFVLPKFKVFFEGLDVELPLPTRLLLAITGLTGKWWWVLALALVCAILAYLAAIRTTSGRRMRDRMLLRIPVIGGTIRFAIIERFTRILASMVRAGIAIPESMQVATDSLHNLVYEEALAKTRIEIVEGGGVADPIAATGLFPGMATQMIRVGENTGTLDTQLEVAASYYERELEYKVKKVMSLMEPAVIIVMGGTVGFVAVALVSAMYGIFRSVHLS